MVVLNFQGLLDIVANYIINVFYCVYLPFKYSLFGQHFEGTYYVCEVSSANMSVNFCSLRATVS